MIDLCYMKERRAHTNISLDEMAVYRDFFYTRYKRIDECEIKRDANYSMRNRLSIFWCYTKENARMINVEAKDERKGQAHKL